MCCPMHDVRSINKEEGKMTHTLENRVLHLVLFDAAGTGITAAYMQLFHGPQIRLRCWESSRGHGRHWQAREESCEIKSLGWTYSRNDRNSPSGLGKSPGTL